ncbi:hypothetical protein EON64_09115 [archaeon]|nr:MAG: hypothetical protein EON64_09115 [archaeon]
MLTLYAMQIVRSVAMLHSRENFSHTIATSKNAQHELVTTGIYSRLRHPAYFGWFYWSVGTQCMLCNPFCTAAYAYFSWSFFKERIPFEEKMLHSFFGTRYREYAEKTPIGIPFIQSQAYD